MSLMWWWVAGAMGGIILATLLDDPSVPAWKTRNLYRCVCLVLYVALGLVCFKALLWRQELRWLLSHYGG